MSNCTSLADPFLAPPGTSCDGISRTSSLSVNVNCNSHHQPSRSRRNSASDDRMSFTKSTALSRTKREMTLSSNAETLVQQSSANSNLLEHQNFNCPLTLSGRDCRLCPPEIQPNNYSYMSLKRYRSHSQSQSTRSIESQVPQSFSQQLRRRRRVHSESLSSTSTTYTTTNDKKAEMSHPMMTSLCTKCKRDVSACSGNDFCDDDSCGLKLNFKFNLTQSCGISEWNLEFASTLHRFIARFSGRRRRPRIRALNSLATSPWATMTSFICVIIIVVTACLPFHIADACSSRSTPKPRPPSPTLRPNITIQTYTCPPEYDAHYCLNGATCFTVKIGESILYNCECAEGYMGQRCEFKDLDGSYLPSKQRAMLEQAGLTSGAVIIVVLVVIVCFYLYVRSRRKSDMSRRDDGDVTDGVDDYERRRMPFSGSNYYNTYHNPTTISISSSQSLHSPSSPYHHPDTLEGSVPKVEPTLYTSSHFSQKNNIEPPDPGPTP